MTMWTWNSALREHRAAMQAAGWLDLFCANLSGANLSNADLSGADLTGANFTNADLRDANFTNANLASANLTNARLANVDLTGANLTNANVTNANLSGVKNLLDPAEWLESEFSRTPENNGYVVYKRFGRTEHKQPDGWSGGPGTIIEERGVNPLRTYNCASGVNFATQTWCNSNYVNAELWVCVLLDRDLPTVVVPYNTDGKARCAQLTKARRIE